MSDRDGKVKRNAGKKVKKRRKKRRKGRGKTTVQREEKIKTNVRRR